MPQLSVLESTRVGPGMSGYDAVQQSVAVAVAADDCGYHRIWVTEHHGQPTIASSAPAVLVAHIAARTTGLRVGSGGVVLSNHPPLVVAEQFSTLEALHPGRIDLGIGGAAGASASSPVLQRALHHTSRSAGAMYPARIDELIGFVAGAFPAGHPYAEVGVSPRVDAVPIFVLGSSVASAGLAAERGLPFVFGNHLGVTAPEPVLRRYRESFRPSPRLAGPYVIVSVGVVCAPTDAAADDIAVTAALAMLRRRPAGATGVAVTTVPDTPAERSLATAVLSRGSIVVGSPSTVTDGLVRLADRTGADELMVVPIELDGPGRIRTVRLVADGHRAATSAIG